MSLINPATLTFNGEEIRSISEAVIERLFTKPDVTAFHTIYENIVAKKQIAFLGRLSKITKKDNGCGTGITTPTIPSSEKFWLPENVKIWIQQCASDLYESFLVYGMNNGIDKYDLTASDFATFVVERMSDGALEDLYRIVWFNDTDAANYNSSPAGVITNGVSLGDYNIIDGMWKQLFAIASADTARRVTIAANAEATTSLQYSVLNASNGVAAKNVFNSLVNTADYRLKGAADKVIVSTQSLVDAYANYLESQGNDASFVRIEGGFSTLRYRNQEIIGFDFWDRTIQADFNNGTKLFLPHRAIMTTKSNLAVGFDASSGVSDFKVFYDDMTETNNFKGAYKVDAKVLEDYMVQVAY
jgi:hypothetical protein